MINNSTNPVEWALLINELDDASEHLANLSRKMANQGAISSEDFAIQLGHIYAHLNRAWYSRNRGEEIKDDEWEQTSQYPADLKPV